MDNEKSKLGAQQVDIHVVISRFIENISDKHKIDSKYIMVSYDKRDGTIDVWSVISGKRETLLEQILINDL